MIIKNERILDYMSHLKVDVESNFLSKYINFLILDHCLNFAESLKIIEFIDDETILYLKNFLKDQISVLQKDKNDLDLVFLEKKHFNFLDKDKDKYMFNVFEYKFREIKQNKENYLNSYLELIST
jgi:hypothetical protein